MPKPNSKSRVVIRGVRTDAPPRDWLRPWLLAGVTAVYVARPLLTSESAAETGDGMPLVMLVLVLAGLWTVRAALMRRATVRADWADLALAVFLLLHTASAVWALQTAAPRPAVNMMWEWIGLGVGYFLLRQLVVKPREMRAIVVVMIGLATSLSCFGIEQYFISLPADQARWINDPEGVLREAGVVAPPGSRQRVLFEQRINSTEPMATFALANSLAGFLAPWLAVTLGVGLSLRWLAYSSPLRERLGEGEAASQSQHGLQRRANADEPRPSPTPPYKGGEYSTSHPLSVRRLFSIRRLLGSRDATGNARVALGLGCAGLLIAACLLLTKSRAAFLAVGCGVGMLIVLVGWRKSARATVLTAPLVAAAAAILCSAAVAVGALDRQVLTEAGKSFSYRWQYWQASWSMIREYPWAGCGPGNFQGSYTRYKLPEASEVIADPHDFLMEVWATAGTPAALAFLAFLGCVGWRMLRPRSVSHSVHGVATEHDAGDSGSERFVVAGGVGGFALALGLSPLATVPLSLSAAVVGLAVAAAVVALAYKWILRGSLLEPVPAIGAIVLLVNLLAAGGIGYPGVSGSLWLLIALSLVDRGGERELPRSAALGTVAMAAVLVVGCYVTAYRPVLRCAEAFNRAESETNPARVEAHLYGAAEADPFSADPWRKLAAVEWVRWQREPSAAAFARFKAANDNALRLAPRTSAAQQARGEMAREAYQRSQNPDDLRDAVDHYQRAVELYPNHPTGRAHLATALAEVGEHETAAIEAAEALRLDDITPHADQKLSAELRGRMSRIQSAK